jgi:hypothetical protein
MIALYLRETIHRGALGGSGSEVGARNPDGGERMTARSIEFCDSQVFPGHWHRTHASIVSGGITSIRLSMR